MAKLKMDGSSKMAVGMWAKDGEYVEFSQKCDCDGKVRSRGDNGPALSS